MTLWKLRPSYSVRKDSMDWEMVRLLGVAKEMRYCILI
jgi:hypothetical protein